MKDFKTFERAFFDARTAGRNPIIAEIKRKTKNRVEVDSRPAGSLARQFVLGGACAISVVCERSKYRGNPDKDIPAIVSSVDMPLLIKDLISHPSQIGSYLDLIKRCDKVNSQVALLLIAGTLKSRLPALVSATLDVGILPFIEFSDTSDLAWIARCLQPYIVGYNNAKKNETVNLQHGLNAQLNHVLGHDVLLVSASNHRDAADVRTSIARGANAVLIGSALMRSSNPKWLISQFARPQIA